MSGGRIPSAEALVEAAVEATGLDDFGEPTWREGVERYVDALNDTADLNEIGVSVAGDGVVTDLGTRLQLVHWRNEHPSVAEQEIVRPIVIVGLPRTGTSILHDLMAQDRSMRAPISWEVERPVPPPQTATFETDPRIELAQAQFDLVDSIIPGFTAYVFIAAMTATSFDRTTTWIGKVWWRRLHQRHRPFA